MSGTPFFPQPHRGGSGLRKPVTSPLSRRLHPAPHHLHRLLQPPRPRLRLLRLRNPAAILFAMRVAQLFEKRQQLLLLHQRCQIFRNFNRPLRLILPKHHPQRIADVLPRLLANRFQYPQHVFRRAALRQRSSVRNPIQRRLHWHPAPRPTLFLHVIGKQHKRPAAPHFLNLRREAVLFHGTTLSLLRCRVPHICSVLADMGFHKSPWCPIPSHGPSIGHKTKIIRGPSSDHHRHSSPFRPIPALPPPLRLGGPRLQRRRHRLGIRRARHWLR